MKINKKQTFAILPREVTSTKRRCKSKSLPHDWDSENRKQYYLIYIQMKPTYQKNQSKERSKHINAVSQKQPRCRRRRSPSKHIAKSLSLQSPESEWRYWSWAVESWWSAAAEKSMKRRRVSQISISEARAQGREVGFNGGKFHF